MADRSPSIEATPSPPPLVEWFPVTGSTLIAFASDEAFAASLADHEEVWVHAVKKGVECRKAAQPPNGEDPPIVLLLGCLRFQVSIRKRLRRLAKLSRKSQVGAATTGKSQSSRVEPKQEGSAKAEEGTEQEEDGPEASKTQPAQPAQAARGEAEVEEDVSNVEVATLLSMFLGLEVFCAADLAAAQESERLRGRRVGLLLVTTEHAAGVFSHLREVSEHKTAPGLELQKGCTVALLGLPKGGLCSLHPECAVVAYGFEQDADKKHILNLKKGQALQRAVKQDEEERFPTAEDLEVRGYGVPVTSALVIYTDGWVEALQNPVVRMRPLHKCEKEEDSEEEQDRVPILPGAAAAAAAAAAKEKEQEKENEKEKEKEKKAPSKTCKEKKRWELMDTDENIYGLPEGLAPHVSPIATAAEWLLGGSGLAFTGAGISRESGVPTFRDGDGLWERYDAMEVSSIGGFAGEPAKVWDFEREFNDILDNCSGPNDGHRALAEMEKLGRVSLVVTQNVDGFQQLAGSQEVLELHGSEVHAICLNKECNHRVEMKYIFEEAKRFEDNEEKEVDKQGSLKQKRECEDVIDGPPENPSYWSEFATGWGVRWPPRPDDSKLQQTVRCQLEGLQRAKKRRKTENKDRPEGTAQGKTEDDDAKSSSDSDSIISESSSSSSSSSAPGPKEKCKKALTKACAARALTEEQLKVGPPRCRIPICPKCRNGVLKPDGIFFGESLEPAVLERSVKQSAKSKVVLMVGTSGTVDPAAKLPLVAKKRSGAKIIEVNIGETRLSPIADLCLRGPSAYILPKVLDAMKKHPKFAEVVKGEGKKDRSE